MRVLTSKRVFVYDYSHLKTACIIRYDKNLPYLLVDVKFRAGQQRSYGGLYV